MTKKALTAAATVTAGALLGLIASIPLSAATGSSPEPASATLTLDDVPGFGRTSHGMDRDDQIAAYQTFLREQHTRGCMASAGWTYHIDLRYPADGLRRLVVAQASAAATPSAVSPHEANRQFFGQLDTKAQDAYMRALYGETAADVKFVETHDGRIPPDHSADTFGDGGCKGQALQQVGRIWDLRERLMPEYLALRTQLRDSPDMTAANVDLKACAAEFGVPGVTGPWSIDGLAAAEAADPKLLQAVEEACLPAWAEADDSSRVTAEQIFLALHAADLATQVTDYAALYEQSRNDVAFADAVAQEIASANQ